MKYSVTKEMSFEAAHIITGHAKDCKNLHGHSYKVQATLSEDECMLDDLGMVIDFSKLKQCMSEIIGAMDHAFIHNINTPEGTLEYDIARTLATHGAKVFEMTAPPTAEKMAALIKSYIARTFPAHEVSVKVWETATSFAEVR